MRVTSKSIKFSRDGSLAKFFNNINENFATADLYKALVNRNVKKVERSLEDGADSRNNIIQEMALPILINKTAGSDKEYEARTAEVLDAYLSEGGAMCLTTCVVVDRMTDDARLGQVKAVLVKHGRNLTKASEVKVKKLAC